MARRTSKQAEAESSTDTTTEAPEEAAVTTTENEAAEQPTEEATSTEEATTEKKDKPIDLTAFQATAKTAVDESDETTGTIDEAHMSKVVEQYRLLDGIKAKNKAKAWLNAQMKESMNEDSIQRARAYLQLHDGMSAGAKSSAEKVPADPTEAFVQRTTVLKLANSLLLPGEGVTDDWTDKANALFDQLKPEADALVAYLADTSEDKGEAPEVNGLVKSAVKLSQGKSAKAGSKSSGGSTYSGERRDIAAHITEAFADQEDGTFLTVAEIRKFRSNEYGDSPPSAGAISARLFPGGDAEKNTVKGTQSGTNEKGIKGATKVSA